MDYTFTTNSDMPVQLVSPSYVPPQNGDPNPAVVYVNPNIETNCENAARDIIEYLEEIGMTSYQSIDPTDLSDKITLLIKKNITGNVKFTFAR